MRQVTLMISAMALFLSSSCNMSDEDRCPKGFEYNPTDKYCFQVEDSSSENEGGSDTGGNGMTDGGDLDSPDAGTDVDTAGGSDNGQSGETGLGTPCETSDQCVGLAADYCVYSPTLGKGFCSFLDCSPGGCPNDFVCCDCTQVEVFGEVACLSPEFAGYAPMIGCTCEQ
jgi:hypothetical protein